MSTPSILLLSKTNEASRAAQRFLLAHAPDAVVVEGERGEPLSPRALSWSGDYLLSFLGPWIVPPALLARASQGALNFHPGSPDYPGIGCYNFALYDEAREYGVVCHEMAPAVDTGRILRVVRFPILPTDTVALLKDRSLTHMLALFFDVAGAVVRRQPLDWSDERWAKRPYTRRELNDLCRLTPDMDEREIRRRVRATTFPGAPGPYYADVGGR